MGTKIKAIIFDCDGVLVDSEKISCSVFAEMMRERGAQVTDQEVILEIKGGSIEHSLAYASTHISGLHHENFETEYRARSFHAFRKEMVPVKGIPELLKIIEIPKSIVSNGPSSKILLNLELTNLLNFFQRHLIFSGHDLKKFKPDPYLFLMASKHMGVHPKNCIVIEDSAHGAHAAQAAGMTCYGYTEMTHPDVFIPYNAIPFSSMEEISTIIA